MMLSALIRLIPSLDFIVSMVIVKYLPLENVRDSSLNFIVSMIIVRKFGKLFYYHHKRFTYQESEQEVLKTLFTSWWLSSTVVVGEIRGKSVVFIFGYFSAIQLI